MHPVAFKPPNGKLRMWVKSQLYCPNCGQAKLWSEVGVSETIAKICSACRTPSTIIRPLQSGEDDLIAGRLSTEP